MMEAWTAIFVVSISIILLVAVSAVICTVVIAVKDRNWFYVAFVAVAILALVSAAMMNRFA